MHYLYTINLIDRNSYIAALNTKVNQPTANSVFHVFEIKKMKCYLEFIQF